MPLLALGLPAIDTLLGAEVLFVLLIRQLGIRARARSLAQRQRQEIRTRLSDLNTATADKVPRDRPLLTGAEL